MHIVVIILGFVAFLVGVAAIAFGFSIKEFSFGATLLIIGTTSAMGGLVMIAIGFAVRELHRIATALTSRPAAPRFPRPGEPFDPYAPASFRPGMNAPRMPPVPPAPMPPPSAGPEGPARDSRPRDAKLEAAVPAEPVPELTEPTSPSLQPQEQTSPEAPTVLEEPQAIPLSPEDSPRLPGFEIPDGQPERAPEPEAEAQPAAQQHDEQRDTMAATQEEAAPTEPPAERERPSPFDAIWPPRGRAARRRAEAAAEDAAPARLQGETASPAEEASAAVNVPAVQTDVSPELQVVAGEPSAPEAEAADVKAEEPQPVSILKSGVVDGMAYTLYSDGSIEAELPSGTIRFESIQALRLHLEKTG